MLALIGSCLTASVFAQTAPVPVTYTQQPVSVVSSAGGNATFSFSVSVPVAAASLAAVAFLNGNNDGSRFNQLSASSTTVGSTTVGSFTLQIANVTAADIGTYTFTVAVNGTYYTNYNISNAVTLAFGTPAAPTITTQPVSQTVAGNSSATFTVVATGTPTPTYQWQLNGVAIAGATNSSYTVQQASVAPGAYTVVVTNSAGTITSSPAVLTILGAPTITNQPTGATVSAGQSVTLSVSATDAASGNDLTYQWYRNGTNGPIAGATSSTYTIASVQATNVGAYTVVVSNPAGSVTSSSATVALIITAHLTNLSARAAVGTGSNQLIAGFVVGGSGVKSLLIRADGPSLAAYGITGVLSNPILSLADVNSNVLNTNTGWGGTTLLSNVFTQVGAFPWPSSSADSALYTSLSTGNYTAAISGVNSGTGVALAEIYDADTGTPTARLINLAARASVGTGSNILIAGFVIAGAGSEKVLIRGTGPALAAYGIAGTLTVPQLTLSNTSGIIATNLNGWSNAPVQGPFASAATVPAQAASAAAMAAVGAFPLTAGSADTAMLITLPPGNYTAQLAGANSTTGVGLIEIYESP